MGFPMLPLAAVCIELGIMTTLLALVAATLAPALLMALWYLHGQFSAFEASDPYIWVRSLKFLLLCLAITALHVVFLGGTAYAVLKWRKLVRWWSSVVAGFVLATLPIAFFTWPLRFPSLRATTSVNGVQTMVDGKPTAAGWLQYAEVVLFFGAWGALSGLVFWLVWRRGKRAVRSSSVAQ